MHGILKKK
jgi:hypothetical protein